MALGFADGVDAEAVPARFECVIVGRPSQYVPPATR